MKNPFLSPNYLNLAIALLLSGLGTATAIATPLTAPSPTLPMQLAQTNSLQGSWRLTNLGTLDSPMVPLQATPLTAEFSGDRVAGSGGCNRFTGGYQTTGNQLTIGPLASTKKACPGPIMTQEMQYLTALQGAQRYEITDQGLQIFYTTDQESGVMRFVRQGVPALW